MCVCCCRYPTGVKRPRLDPSKLERLCEFLRGACPAKSGDKSGRPRQYITDDALWRAYTHIIPHPLDRVSFNTFWRVKHDMRVKAAGKSKYWGQFDCSKCARLLHLPTLIARADTDARRVVLERDLQKCLLHEETKNPNAISTSCSGIKSSHASSSS